MNTSSLFLPKCVQGIDALPGMAILSTFLEAASGSRHGYARAEDMNRGYASEASWTRHLLRPKERRHKAEDRTVPSELYQIFIPYWSFSSETMSVKLTSTA